jgi:hypothetical protein
MEVHTRIAVIESENVEGIDLETSQYRWRDVGRRPTMLGTNGAVMLIEERQMKDIADSNVTMIASFLLTFNLMWLCPNGWTEPQTVRPIAPQGIDPKGSYRVLAPELVGLLELPVERVGVLAGMDRLAKLHGDGSLGEPTNEVGRSMVSFMDRSLPMWPRDEPRMDPIGSSVCAR